MSETNWSRFVLACLRTPLLFAKGQRSRGSVSRHLLLTGSIVTAALLGVSCGSPGEAAGQACQRIAEVLDMSPVQSADPSGFALFQIGPLGKIRTSDTTLQLAIDRLVPADRVIASATASARAVAAASKVAAHEDDIINGQCPGLGI